MVTNTDTSMATSMTMSMATMAITMVTMKTTVLTTTAHTSREVSAQRVSRGGSLRGHAVLATARRLCPRPAVQTLLDHHHMVPTRRVHIYPSQASCDVHA